MMQRIAHLYWLQAIVTFINAGFVAILYVHFFKQHISIADFLLAEGLGCLAVAVYIALRKKVTTGRDIQAGFVIFGIGLAVLLFPFSRFLFFAYAIFRVLGVIMFYIPYNIVLFENHNKEKSLQTMTHYWIVGILSGIVGPLIGAYLFVHAGIFAFICIALIVLFGGIMYSRIVENRVYPYTFSDLVKRTATLRSIIMVDGALHKVSAIIMIFALVYFNTEFTYGGFLSFVSFVALFFMTYIAKVSDKNKKRMEFIWPLSLLLAGITTLFGFFHTGLAFVTLTILLRIFSMLVEPLRSTILLDSKGSDALNWISREFWLNIGRATIFLVSFVFLKINNPTLVFLFCASLHALFPFLVHYKRIYALPH